jgi:hypothetical protein
MDHQLSPKPENNSRKGKKTMYVYKFQVLITFSSAELLEKAI